MEVQSVSEVEIDLFATGGDDECPIGKISNEVLKKTFRNIESVIGLPICW